MNQQIARQDRWGRPQILERADALAERIVANWPGPAAVVADSGVLWDVMNRALAELPSGAWTSYGDVAALIGSHPVPVGMRLATTEVPNAHRVLQTAGTVSPGFRWPDPMCTDDPRDRLREEGVFFDNHGRAHAAQRMTTEDLAQLAGITTEDLPEALPAPQPGQDAALRDRFVAQLGESQGADTTHATLVLLDAWTAMGGTLQYGRAPSETSCFLMARRDDEPGAAIWPVAVYPSGRCEVVFQYLRTRAPFDDTAAREELRQRLNKVPGIELAEAKLELRPSFALDLLKSPSALDALIEQLGWFYAQARSDR
jgi:alkylated DNA nucleotide flippase Atl1